MCDDRIAIIKEALSSRCYLIIIYMKNSLELFKSSTPSYLFLMRYTLLHTHLMLMGSSWLSHLNYSFWNFMVFLPFNTFWYLLIPFDNFWITFWYLLDTFWIPFDTFWINFGYLLDNFWYFLNNFWYILIFLNPFNTHFELYTSGPFYLIFSHSLTLSLSLISWRWDIIFLLCETYIVLSTYIG